MGVESLYLMGLKIDSRTQLIFYIKSILCGIKDNSIIYVFIYLWWHRKHDMKPSNEIL